MRSISFSLRVTCHGIRCQGNKLMISLYFHFRRLWSWHSGYDWWVRCSVAVETAGQIDRRRADLEIWWHVDLEERGLGSCRHLECCGTEGRRPQHREDQFVRIDLFHWNGKNFTDHSASTQWTATGCPEGFPWWLFVRWVLRVSWRPCRLQEATTTARTEAGPEPIRAADWLGEVRDATCLQKPDVNKILRNYRGYDYVTMYLNLHKVCSTIRHLCTGRSFGFLCCPNHLTFSCFSPTFLLYSSIGSFFFWRGRV